MTGYRVRVTNELTQIAWDVVVEADGPVSAQVAALRRMWISFDWRWATAGHAEEVDQWDA